MFLWLVVFPIIALTVYNGYVYASSPGTTIERLSAAWKGSSTLFIGVWGFILSMASGGLEMLGQLTGDPQFNQLADQVKGIIPPQYQHLVPIGTILLMMIARLRTAGK